MYRKKTRKPYKTSPCFTERTCTFQKIDFSSCINSYNPSSMEIIVTQGGRNVQNYENTTNKALNYNNNNPNDYLLNQNSYIFPLQNDLIPQNEMINFDSDLEILKEKETILKTIWLQLERFVLLDSLNKNNELELQKILKKPIILKPVNGEI